MTPKTDIDPRPTLTVTYEAVAPKDTPQEVDTEYVLAREHCCGFEAARMDFEEDEFTFELSGLRKYSEAIRADEREKLLGGSVEAVALERWGRAENICLRLLDRMDDGYWTPWHIATEHLTSLAARVAQMQAEIERLKAENDAITDLNHSQFLALENKRSLAEYPAKCPITRRDFFMVIEHPELGTVPTYGGPYDSYTIPEMGGKADQPWHERELFVHRYDHDFGGWVGDETIPLLVINDDELQTRQSRVDELEADASAFQTAADLGLTLRFYGGCAQSGMPGSPSAYEVISGSDRATAMREAVSRCKAINDAARKQGGAQ